MGNRKKVLIAAILVAVVLGGFAVWENANHVSATPTTVETTDQKREWAETAFGKHLTSLSKTDGGVRFKNDGFFVADVHQAATTDFVIGKNEPFRTRPDHHSVMTCRIEKIHEDGVVIAYELRLDHRAFGKNLITIDRGTVKLKWEG